MPFEADHFCVHSFVRLEIIQRPAGAPGPCPQRAPIIRLAGLAFIDQADDTLCQTGAVIGLNAAGADRRVAPSLCENLLLPCGTGRATSASTTRSAKRQ